MQAHTEQIATCQDVASVLKCNGGNNLRDSFGNDVPSKMLTKTEENVTITSSDRPRAAIDQYTNSNERLTTVFPVPVLYLCESLSIMNTRHPRKKHVIDN